MQANWAHGLWGVALAGLVAALVGSWTRPAQALTVEALSIIGKNDDSGMDKSIPSSVRDALKKGFPYKSYKLANRDSRAATIGQVTKLTLTGGYSLTVKPLRAEGQGEKRKIKLTVAIVKGDAAKLTATIDLKPDRYFPMEGPPVDSGTLIVFMAVSE